MLYLCHASLTDIINGILSLVGLIADYVHPCRAVANLAENPDLHFLPRS